MTGIIANFAISGYVDMLQLSMFAKIILNFLDVSRPTHLGLPNDWKKVDKDQEDVNYVTITEDGLRADVNPKANNYAFWDNFFIKYQHLLHKC